MAFGIKGSSFIASAFFGTTFALGSLAATAVPTYHYDTYRTGWNNQETGLTATSFPSTFGQQASVALDDQVDAQPLLVPGVTIAGGVHDVVYVATESNTVYAIDASSGTILLSNNFGAPVPTPLGCTNNGPNVGIDGTPTIDLATQTLYVITYLNGTPPSYKLHALSLSTLADKITPVVVAASHTLTNGSVYTFNATVQRQRPGLIELGGNVYAAFGSFCDFRSSISRGWLLGWNASTLVPLTSNRLDDSLGTSTNNYFLSSIWMSGYGISGAGVGSNARLQFTTGNSDPTSYTGTTNIQESILKTDLNPANLLGIFTPSNWSALDAADTDLGSGGVLHLPTQPGSYPYLAIGGGKDGRLFLLNRLAMGTPLDVHQLGGCWCGPSYFVGSDGIPRIVTSHGNTLSTWKLMLSPAPHLVQEGSVGISTGQDPGFFTVVSSNGTQNGTAIIWAVSRPDAANPAPTLYAFAAMSTNGTLTKLFSMPAGTWPNIQGNANIVPVVANGKVYVASYKALTIFGAPGVAIAAKSAFAAKSALPIPVASLGTHSTTGILMAIDGKTLTIQTRTGQIVKIDASLATKNEQVGALHLGEPYIAMGESLTVTGALLATSIVRGKGSADLWPADH
jgi:hypothetical protein